jgi:hypothetical protein
MIAIASLVFNTNQNFQMAAMLLVLFMAYAAQVRFLPYMGPGNFDQVLRDHEKAAKEGHPIHSKLVGVIARVQAQGRKRTYANTFNGAQKISMGSLAGALVKFLFDYNTVEALLLASALLVALAGVMFGATDSTKNSSFYRDSREGVMSAILIVVALSIIYWLTVVVVEVYVMLMEQQAASARTKSSGGKGKGKNLEGEGEGEGSAHAGARNSAALGPVETLTNPMFMNKEGKAAGNVSGLSVDAIREMELPEGPVWMAVREAYVAQAEHAAAVAAEVAKLKAEVAKARMAAGGSSGEDAEEVPSTPKSAKKRA